MGEGDWRMQGQERYLKGAVLHRTRYSRRSESWDHDHCEFCCAKFAEPDVAPEALREGYATADKYRWICADCFNDFKERFGWRVP